MLKLRLWDSKETRAIKVVINRVSKFLHNEIGDDLISLYLVGSILTKRRHKGSDIDIFAVVDLDFNFRLERKISDAINSNSVMTNGIPVDFHGVCITELYGGKPRSIMTTHMLNRTPIEAIIKEVKSGTHLDGVKIDFKKLPGNRWNIKKEFEYYIKCANMSLLKIKKQRYNKPFIQFVKLIRKVKDVEEKIRYGLKFDRVIKKTIERVKNEEDKLAKLAKNFKGDVESVVFKGKFVELSEKFLNDIKKEDDLVYNN